MEEIMKLMNGDGKYAEEDDINKVKQALASLKAKDLIDYEVCKAADGGDDIVRLRILKPNFDFQKPTAH